MLHDLKRTIKYIVDNGKREYLRREKYCDEHGWIDLLAAGGEIVWDERHERCGGAPTVSNKFIKRRPAAKDEPDEEKMRLAAVASD